MLSSSRIVIWYWSRTVRCERWSRQISGCRTPKHPNAQSRMMIRVAFCYSNKKMERRKKIIKRRRRRRRRRRTLSEQQHQRVVESSCTVTTLLLPARTGKCFHYEKEIRKGKERDVYISLQQAKQAGTCNTLARLVYSKWFLILDSSIRALRQHTHTKMKG